MKAFIPAIIAASLIIVVWLVLWKVGAWQYLHRRVVGFLILVYGAYLATLTGTATQFVFPGIGAIGGGAAAGAGIGLLTYAVIGTVGVVTGGAGWAIGAGLMALFGAGFGAVGGAAGGIGFRTVSSPLVSPIFWVPLLIVAVYLIVGSGKRHTQSTEQQQLPPPERKE